MDDRDIVPMLRKYSNSFDLIAADYIERLEADVWKIKPGDPSTGPSGPTLRGLKGQRQSE